MATYSRREAAERAGSTQEELSEMISLGIVNPSGSKELTEADVRRLGFVTHLVAGGLPLEGLAAELKSGRLSLDFLDSPAFDGMIPDLTNQTFEELAAVTSIPINLLMAIREAVGSAVPNANDRVRELELAIVPLIQAQLASGYSANAIERLMRTTGDSMRRIATATIDSFNEFVIAPVARGQDAQGRDIAAAAVTAGERMLEPNRRALLAIYAGQQRHATTSNILDGFERDLKAAGLTKNVRGLPAICFLDVTGYTRLTAERGDAAAAELAQNLARLVQRTSMQHGGRPIKWLGDGVMIWFRDPGPAVVAALEMSDGVAGAGLPPAHVGIHAGAVVMQDGDYYGQTVNLASRIAGYARPGEVVVSQAVVESAGDAPLTFVDLGNVELKGVPEPIRLHTARRA